MPSVGHENVRHATLLFRAEGVNVRTKVGVGEKDHLMTAEELKKLQAAAQPDDSVAVPPYEGTTPEDAAVLEGILDKKVGKMDVDAQSEYETMQQIADRGGVLPSDVNLDDESFSGAQDTPKEEGE